MNIIMLLDNHHHSKVANPAALSMGNVGATGLFSHPPVAARHR